MMELKQLAESITMISHKKKIPTSSHQTFKNRPLLWAEKLDIAKE
jgi:hypothetical protein